MTEAAVLNALRGVMDPEQKKDIVALGMVRDVQIADAQVSLTLAFTTQSPQSRVTMHSMASRLVGQLPGVTKVQVKMGGAQGPAPKAQAHAHAPAPPGA
ncbi:MAG: iron-sulfur cluster assembly protein, partial [Candidatus Rokuibacteriota bacterium]